MSYKVHGGLVTDGRIESAHSIKVPVWQPNTDYVTGDLFRDPSTGQFYRVVNNHTSGGSFTVTADIALIEGSGGITPVLASGSGTAAVDTREILLGTSAFTRTLPAATGSGKIVQFATTDTVGSSKTIAVQSGEYLNGSLNGTFTIDRSKSTYLATDVEAGKWTVVKLTAGVPRTADFARGILTGSVSVTSFTVVPFSQHAATGNIFISSGGIYLRGGRRYIVEAGFKLDTLDAGEFLVITLTGNTGGTPLYNNELVMVGRNSTSPTEQGAQFLSAVCTPTSDGYVYFNRHNYSGSFNVSQYATYCQAIEIPTVYYD